MTVQLIGVRCLLSKSSVSVDLSSGVCAGTINPALHEPLYDDDEEGLYGHLKKKILKKNIMKST